VEEAAPAAEVIGRALVLERQLRAFDLDLHATHGVLRRGHRQVSVGDRGHAPQSIHRRLGHGTRTIASMEPTRTDARADPRSETRAEPRAALEAEHARLREELAATIEVPGQMTYGSQAAAATHVFEQQRDL